MDVHAERFTLSRADRGPAGHVPAADRGEGPRLRGLRSSRRRPPSWSPTGSGCARCSGTCSPTRSSSPRTGGWRCGCGPSAAAAAPSRVRAGRAGTAPGTAGSRGVLRHRHRDRHRAGEPRRDLRRVPAGRRDAQPPVRRHRARAVDRQRGQRAARRPITATSDLGSGSTFTLYVPADAAGHPGGGRGWRGVRRGGRGTGGRLRDGPRGPTAARPGSPVLYGLEGPVPNGLARLAALAEHGDAAGLGDFGGGGDTGGPATPAVLTAPQGPAGAPGLPERGSGARPTGTR